MPYIAREDGEHFVIPTYRDTLRVKNKVDLKKEIISLSDRYGAYITLQKKGLTNQYEIAVSPDTGFLLGESIWHYFKRPVDLIYCEAMQNGKDALLVIVSGSNVYLDGIFPLENIQEELIALINQKNQFEIYTYGDVPIASEPSPDKFNFNVQSIKSFQVMDHPIFPILPRYRQFQFQLVDSVLKSYGIGVFPIKPLLAFLFMAGLLVYYWEDLSFKKAQEVSAPLNPLALYSQMLSSPSPQIELSALIDDLAFLYRLPGWIPIKFNKTDKTCSAKLQSVGGNMQDLFLFAKQNNASINLQKDGITINWNHPLYLNRPIPNFIYPINEVIAVFADRLHQTYPGNHLSLGEMNTSNNYKNIILEVKVEGVSPALLLTIGKHFDDLPIIFSRAQFDINNGLLSGSISWQALGD